MPVPKFLILTALLLALSPTGQGTAQYELVPQMIHEYALNDLAYGPNGACFASASYDRVVLWEIQTGKQIRVYPGMGRGFTSVAFSGDGKRLAAGTMDQTVVIWNLETGQVEHVLQGHSYGVRDIAFSPNGRQLASVASRLAAKPEDETTPGLKAVGGVLGEWLIKKEKFSELKIWDVETGAEIIQFPKDQSPVEPICYSPDGKTIAGGGVAFTAGLWDVETGQVMRIYTHRNFHLQALAFSPDGKRLAGAYWGRDYQQFPARGVQVWDTATRAVIHDFSGYKGFVQDLAFSPDGAQIVTAANDYPVYLPEKPKKRSLVTALNDRNGSAERRDPSEKFTDDPDSVWYREPDGTYKSNAHPKEGYKLGELKLWNAADGSPAGVFIRQSSPIYTVAFGPDNHIVSDGEGYAIKRWNAENFKETHSVQGVASEVQDLVFSPNGALVANLDMSNCFRVWDVANMRRIRLFRGHEKRINAVAFSPDSKQIASSSEDKTIRIWDLESGDQLHALQCDKYPRGLAFHPSGKWLVGLEWPHLGLRTVRDKALTWWDLKTLTPLKFKDKEAWQIGKEKYNQASFSRDGRLLLLSAGYRNLGRYEYASAAPTDLWDVASGKPVHRFETSDAADYSDGNRFIVTAQGPKLELIDVATHKKLRSFSGHESWTGRLLDVKQELGVTSVDISPDDRFLVSCGVDKTMRIWDMETGQNLRTLQGRYQLARFSPKGNLIVSAGFDGRLELWNVAELTETDREAQPAATMIGLPKSEDFIAFTPELYYKCTRNGYKAVVVLKDNKAYGFDQFDALLNRPDKVIEALPGSDPNLAAMYHRAYEKRIAGMGLDPNQLALDFRLPELKILDPGPLGATAADKVQITLSIQDPSGQPDRLSAWVNGVPVAGRSGIDLSGKAGTLALPVELSPGPNTLELSVMNKKGVASYRQTLFYEKTGKQPKPDLYLVAVGVSDYSRYGADRDLKFAAEDARDFAKTMEYFRPLFGQIHKVELLNGAATRERITQVRGFLERARVQDQIIFFMAGHGLLDGKGDFYYGAVDIDFMQPEQRGFAYGEIERLMDGLRSRRKLVLIDACHSGAVDKQTRMTQLEPSETEQIRGFRKKTSPKSLLVDQENSFDLARELFVNLNRGSGTMVISAARGNEYAFEREDWGNGAFTYALMKGLSPGEKQNLPRADANEDHQLTITELRRFAMKEVKHITRGRQTPTSREETLNFDYPLLQFPEQKQGLLKQLKNKTLSMLDNFQNRLTRGEWEDEEKPLQFWGKRGAVIQAPELQTGEAIEPEPGYYPAPLTPEKRDRTCRRQLLEFRGCEGEDRMKGADQIFRFRRLNGEKGQLYVYQYQQTTPKAMVDECLNFHFADIAPVHKDYLQQGRTTVVKWETGTLHDKVVMFLTTQTIYDSRAGGMSRIYHHLFHIGPHGGFRVTTAGGHRPDKEDLRSFRHSQTYEAAARRLFERIVFPETAP